MPSWRVPKEESGSRLIEFLKKRHESISSREIKRQIELGFCKLNGKIERFGSVSLAKEDKVEFESQTPVKTEIPSFDPKRILFEDSDILLYNKPPGIATDASGILAHLAPYGAFQLVHRLDKETSGVLLLAKSLSILKSLEEAFKERAVKKVYLALVDGIPKKGEGLIENLLGKISEYAGQTIYGAVKSGLPAKTSWELKKKLKGASLIKCLPETGRTHQIRVHLSEMGHPILGDYQYCKKFRSPYRPKRLMLHAYQLEFVHPVTKKSLSVLAPIPLDFQEALRALELKNTAAALNKLDSDEKTMLSSFKNGEWKSVAAETRGMSKEGEN